MSLETKTKQPTRGKETTRGGARVRPEKIVISFEYLTIVYAILTTVALVENEYLWATIGGTFIIACFCSAAYLKRTLNAEKKEEVLK
jgi:succinate-acetate transporter protein